MLFSKERRRKNNFRNTTWPKGDVQPYHFSAADPASLPKILLKNKGRRIALNGEWTT